MTLTSSLRSLTSTDSEQFPLGLLELTRGNAKLPSSTLILSLPAGHSCPGALTCLSMADQTTGRITDGPATVFRCYAASQETRPAVRSLRWRNFTRLRGHDASHLATLLATSVEAARLSGSPWVERVRLFGSGDCFSAALRDGIIEAATRIPRLTWYFYTKNLPLFVKQDAPIELPENLFLTASWGGRFDALIEAGHFPRNARVVNTAAEAMALKLSVDFSDAMAYDLCPQAFAHLVHGTQPAGSLAGKAISARRKEGLFTGYGPNFTPIHGHE